MTPDSSEQGPEVIAAEATRARSLAVIEKGTPLPAFRGAEMSEALTAYRELQRALDHAMPDQIMELDGKPFRKKGYWRAIAVAFNLRVECVTESEEVDGVFQDSRPNFGWHVVYRAMASNGRAATGDGSCFAVEKAKRRGEADPWAALPRQATQHNVRSHAHTRAFNRAVSNLVGFGEVSAEEVDRDEPARPSTAAPPSTVLDTTTGADVPASARPAPPPGYVYIDSYRLHNGWHQLTILGYDAQGGALKLSTKTQAGFTAGEAFRDGLPVKFTWKMKPNTKGEGYLNQCEAWKPPAHPNDPVTAADIAF